MGSGCGSLRSTRHDKVASLEPMLVVPTAFPGGAAASKTQVVNKGFGEPTMVVGVPEPQAIGVSSNQPRRKAQATLVKAAKAGDVQLVERLLGEGCELEELGMWDNTPLLVACTYNHTQVALRLIAGKASVVARNENGATPLHYAAVEGAVGVAGALVAAAREQGGDAGVAGLVNSGTARVYNRHLDAYTRRTPLGLAAESGFLEVMEVLLAAGAQVDFAGEGGEEQQATALWLACRHSRAGAARLLMERGASTSAKSADGVSVLSAACISCVEDVVLSLLKHGVPDVNDTAGCLLRDAVRAGKIAVVEALLTNGVSLHPTAHDADQSSALHVACEKGNEPLIALLVSSRADPSLHDAADRSPLDLLLKRGMPEAQAASLLCEAEGGDGRTPPLMPADCSGDSAAPAGCSAVGAGAEATPAQGPEVQTLGTEGVRMELQCALFAAAETGELATALEEASLRLAEPPAEPAAGPAEERKPGT